MTNLISNTSFGNLLRYKNIPDYEYRYLRDNYDSFLLQKLEIWMFIPCKLVDGVWVVLEEPTETHETIFHDSESLKGYQEAKERCLFDGFDITNFTKGIKKTINLDNTVHVFYYENFQWNKAIGISTIEDLIKYNLELTQTAKKQIGI